MNSSDLNSNKIIEKITKQLKDKRNLTVVNSNAGKGGFGQIIIVQDGNNKEQAIKIISLFDGFDSICDDKLKNATEEANILAQCNHQNIVKYIDRFQIGVYYLIQMEKCEMSLQDFVDKKLHINMDEQQFISFASQILSGIKYLHMQKLVLRDISLKNILLDKGFNIKLCDFGLAKCIDTAQASQAFLTTQVKGVYIYLPPETLDLANQQQNRVHTKIYQTIEGDIWAFGVCMYLLAGASFQHIIKFTQGVESYQQQQNISPQINEILMKILQVNPQQRPTIEQIIQLFDTLQNSKFKKKESISISVERFLCNQAIKQIDSLDYLDAIQTLLELIQLFPQNDQYHALLGLAYLENSDIEESLKSSQKSININPNNDLAISNQGYYYYYKKEYEKAMDFINRSLQLNPNNYLSLLCKSFVLYAQQKYDEALIASQLSDVINQNYPYTISNIGDIFCIKGNQEEGIKQYKRAIEVSSKFKTPYIKLSQVYRKMKKYDEAIFYLNKLLQMHPSYLEAHNILGLVYNENNMQKKAVDCFKKCVEIEPNNSNYKVNLQIVQEMHQKSLYNLAIKQIDSLDYLDAIQTLLELTQLCPQNDQYHALLGLAYLENSDIEESLKSSQKSININPNNDLAISNQGYYYIHKENEKAMDLINRSLQLNPKNYLSLLYKSFILKHQEKYDEALIASQQSTAINQNYPYTISYIGDIFCIKGNQEEGIKQYKRAIEVSPKFKTPYIQLSQVYRKMKKYDEAIFYLNKLLQIYPSHSEAHNILGLVYNDKKMIDIAADCYKKCVELEPNNQTYKNNLQFFLKLLK